VSLVSLLIAILSVGAHREIPFFTAIDHFFYDQFLKMSTAPALSDRITIIDIDERSLSAVGQWPWPRYRLAQLIGIVSESSPRAIGLDIIFPEADRTSLKELQRQISIWNWAFPGCRPH
jgi:CHASE2 domain-containing sensor protein